LADRVDIGAELLDSAKSSEAQLTSAREAYYSWDEYNRQLLRRRFSTDELSQQYKDVVFAAVGGQMSLAERVSDLNDDIRRKLRRLRSISDQISLFEVDNSVKVQITEAGEAKDAVSVTPDQIFIVHGHNDSMKLQVADFVDKLTGHRPTILHEHANQGRTLIEKLEHHGAGTAFAIVILTGDDEGRLRTSSDELLPRGRQNVVFELGFFVGLLGRSRVVLLYDNDVELPSDMTGIVYERLDSQGGWKLALAREIRTAGISVDLNEAL
jgi:predicted nucleotide-binding protein